MLARRSIRGVACMLLAVTLTACAGGGTSSDPTSTSSATAAPSPTTRTQAYLVQDAGDIGLKVRSCDVEDCEQWGTLYDGTQIAVLCYTESGYNGGQADDKWLRILWERDTESADGGKSDPTQPFEAYVHSAFTRALEAEAPAC